MERSRPSLSASRHSAANTALTDALEEALDAKGDLVDADEEGREPFVLGAVQLLAHRAGEAPLLEELHEPSEGELDAVPHAREEVGDSANVASEGDDEARHHRREHAEDEDGGEDGGHQPAERDVRRLEPDEEEREARLGGADRAAQRDDGAGPNHGSPTTPSRAFRPTRCRPACSSPPRPRLEAGTHVAAGNREALEHLLRYMLRPPVPQHRLRRLADGRLELTLKFPLHDGTRAISLTPSQLMRRLASIVPPPKVPVPT
ncbi:MAG: transposase [Deltaproteobacteria bacterium]|nr:transposase [Deltaproteobacteria bacterium]